MMTEIDTLSRDNNGINIDSNELSSTQTGGILRPCIQFLNIDSSHAVRLFTPPFEKIETTPLTVFCVAIATEDGCFFSGLKKKFEMGHMYPATNAVNDERSPICLNADYTEVIRDQENVNQRRRGNENNHSTMHSTTCDHECNFGSANRSLESGFTCTADAYSGLCSPNKHEEDTDNDDEEECEHIARGQLGPGVWRCYTAIFDGESSIIRINGVDESLHYDSVISPTFQACLDGITIGSDHTFDMSLCFGQGSAGEGEGAMAELALFKGSLDSIDILALEMHLMTKHGIPFPTKPKSERTIDDFYSRLGHALMDQSPSCASDTYMNNTSVPLHYMTKLRNVAWQQTNPVSGEPISVQRIGNKNRVGSSSEW